MNRTIEKRIEDLRRKLSCKFSRCGEQFVFEITQHELDLVKQNERHRYEGKCKRCGKVLKLTSSGISALSIGFGKAEFKVIATTFDDLFEDADQKNDM